MKAKIVSKTYYVAQTEDGNEYVVDIKNPLIKNAYNNGFEIEGIITQEEEQVRFKDGSYDRSYTIIEKFIPIKENQINFNTKEEKEIVNIPIKESKKKTEYIGLPKK